MNIDNINNIDLNVHWYPGHMAKTLKMLKEHISIVDVVIELLDARIPYSSKNPELEKLAANKKRIIALNKADLADKEITSLWIDYYTEKGFKVIAMDSLSGKGVKDILRTSKEIMSEKIENERKRGRINYPIKAMIIGAPNVGKSTLINKFAGRTAARTADKPGVTRGKQWIKKGNFQLLDTPGMLWPKFEDREIGFNLAITGAVSDDVTDIILLSYVFINKLININVNLITDRYKITVEKEDSHEEILEKIAIGRGYILKGDKPDLKRAAINIIDEFRAGKLGALSLETPGDISEVTV